MLTTLSPKRVNAVLEHVVESTRLAPAADDAARRPVHVVYGGAHLFAADVASKLGRIALRSMAEHAKDARAFGEVVGLTNDALAEDLLTRVKKKLEREPVEAYCIDFEDGYGPRSDDEEDADAVRAAAELARARDDERTVDAADGAAARGAGSHEVPVVGIRIKPIAAGGGRRAARTLDLFLTALAKARGGKLPRGLTVTLPKPRRPAEVGALGELLGMLEQGLGARHGAIGIELMIESHRALVGEDGRAALPELVAAAGGRCVAAHLGAYDLTASVDVTATDQRLDNPICDAARVAMQLVLAGTRVAVVDGATTLLPVGSDTAAVHEAWRLHATNVRRALAFGIYQGWDLHPTQLPARFGALYAFFLSERDAMAERLATFVERATHATRSGQVFDDAATGQGLVNFFLRGLSCGALFEVDVAAATGLGVDELRSRSFARIVAARTHARVTP